MKLGFAEYEVLRKALVEFPSTNFSEMLNHSRKLVLGSIRSNNLRSLRSINRELIEGGVK
ncbi:MAG: hypothetical protein J7J51_02455 [Candidatus Omnitrophica bacterium]|nr:hypothetical protein [Candidatus Omnitrophota bacterium]